jgi:hypothetical protein
MVANCFGTSRSAASAADAARQADRADATRQTVAVFMVNS